MAELFALLRKTKTEQLRGEIGLALARIAGEEQYYMQHWRLFQANPDTATAQAILALQKPAKQSLTETFASLTETGAQYFATGNWSKGATILQEMLCQLPKDRLDDSLVHILHECQRGLAEFTGTRLELILLSLHTLNLALKQLNSAHANGSSSPGRGPDHLR